MSELVMSLEAINERLISAPFNRWLGIYAIEGDFVIASELLRAGSRIATVDVRVHSAAGKLLASGRCVYSSDQKRPKPF